MRRATTRPVPSLARNSRHRGMACRWRPRADDQSREWACVPACRSHIRAAAHRASPAPVCRTRFRQSATTGEDRKPRPAKATPRRTASRAQPPAAPRSGTGPRRNDRKPKARLVIVQSGVGLEDQSSRVSFHRWQACESLERLRLIPIRMTRFPVAAFAALATVTLGRLRTFPTSSHRPRPAGEVLAFENDYVQVGLVALEYPAAERRIAEARPVVLYIRLTPSPGVLNTKLLEPPRGAAPSWRPGVVARAVHIELLRSPLRPRNLEEPGTDPPSDASEARVWPGGRLLQAVFRFAALRLRHRPISLRHDVPVGQGRSRCRAGACDVG